MRDFINVFDQVLKEFQVGAINPIWFNGAKPQVSDLVNKFVSSLGGDFSGWYWNVSGGDNLPAKMITGVDAETKEIRAYLVYGAKDGQPPHQEELYGLKEILTHLRHMGSDALANQLEDAGVKALNEQQANLSETYGRGWAILPATMALYNKRTVDIITAASTWDDCVIYVCSKEENGKDRILFLASSGDLGIKVGTSSETYHDQTGASKGNYTVMNIVHIVDGQIVSKSNNIGLDKKASLAVFK